MVEQRSTLEKHLLQLLDPCTSPEKALLSLASPCLTSMAYTHENIEPFFIFLAYFKFIMTKRPNGCVDGIWEEVLRKTLWYSRNMTGINIVKMFILGKSYSGKIFTWVNAGMITEMTSWLKKALHNHVKCPNPLIRLELFRLLYLVDINMKWAPFCKTFVHSMCEINPHCYYQNRDDDDLLFSIVYMKLLIEEMYKKLTQIILSDVSKDLLGARFISNSLQLIKVFIHNADTDPNVLYSNSIYSKAISYCSSVLIIFLDDFKVLVSRPPIRPYLDEVLRELTSSIIHSKERNAERYLRRIRGRDDFVNYLDVHSNSRDLQRLLLLREVGQNQPRQVHQHSLLLRNLYPHYNDEMNPA